MRTKTEQKEVFGNHGKVDPDIFGLSHCRPKLSKPSGQGPAATASI
jgi:hypothetical protein